MEDETYFVLAGIVFSIITVLHLIRIIFSWPLQLNSMNIPLWLSGVSVIVSGTLAILGFLKLRD